MRTLGQAYLLEQVLPVSPTTNLYLTDNQITGLGLPPRGPFHREGSVTPTSRPPPLIMPLKLIYLLLVFPAYTVTNCLHTN